MTAEAGFETKTIEQLGLVAGLFDELGIGELIDEVVPQDRERRNVTVRTAVKAMVLNGLGSANRRLYLTPRFFRNKPTERLLGEGVTPESLNDDTLGRALDALHRFGASELFMLVSQRAVARSGLSPRVAHLDSASFTSTAATNETKRPIRTRILTSWFVSCRATAGTTVLT